MRLSLAAAAVAAALGGIILGGSSGAATQVGAQGGAAPPAAQAPIQPPPAAPDPTAMLAAGQQALILLDNQIPSTSDDRRLASMAAQTAAIDAQVDALQAARASDLVRVDRTLQRIGPRGRRPAPPAEKAKIAALQAQRATLEGQLRQIQVVASTADRVFALVAERRREGFSARVLERSASPLSPDFWGSVADSVGPDLERLATIAGRSADAAGNAEEPNGVISLGLGLLAALILIFPVRWFLEGVGRAKVRRPEVGRFGQTAQAVWTTAVDTGAPALAAAALHISAQWGGLLSGKADAIAGAAVVAVTWSAAVLALGRALATDLDADHRLLGLADGTARRMGFLLSVVAAITGLGFLLSRLNYVVGASVASTIATNCILSLAYAGIAGAILISFGRCRARAEEGDAEAEQARSSIWTLISLTLTAAIVVTVVAVLAGFTTLAALVSNQIFWLSVLVASTFLLVRFVDDLCGLLFNQGAANRVVVSLFNLRHSTVAQAGALVSAGLQLLIVIGAMTLALTPFGRSGDLLFVNLSRLGGAIHIGSAVISPSAIASGLIALAVGLGLVRIVRNWVERRYLPVTDWDVGLRTSVTTGVSYLGVGITLVCALAAMGLGFQQIALIASALSVGIGFGLQQVVQNFVSGIILLIERPVKVGDWVNIAGVEGDIRRIRVRATEIETFDRTTVIVPNSDLITKQVQNKTLGEPRGRIQLQVSIANPADARRAADLIMTLAAERADILKQPKPVVYIDSLAAGGAVNFNCYLYVRTQREVYGARSQLYFAVLEAFAAENIGFIGAAGPASVVVDPGPVMQEALNAMRFGDGARPHDGGNSGASRRPEADEDGPPLSSGD